MITLRRSRAVRRVLYLVPRGTDDQRVAVDVRHRVTVGRVLRIALRRPHAIEPQPIRVATATGRHEHPVAAHLVGKDEGVVVATDVTARPLLASDPNTPRQAHDTNVRTNGTGGQGPAVEVDGADPHALDTAAALTPPGGQFRVVVHPDGYEPAAPAVAVPIDMAPARPMCRCGTQLAPRATSPCAICRATGLANT